MVMICGEVTLVFTVMYIRIRNKMKCSIFVSYLTLPLDCLELDSLLLFLGAPFQIIRRVRLVNIQV